METCFFIGHRDTPEFIFSALVEAVERHITEYGVTEFVVGHYGAFDHMAARAVINAKQRHTSVTLLQLLPYHPAERPVELPKGFDDSFYPPGMEMVPKRFAISRANRFMIHNSRYLIAYAWKPASNAKEFLACANREENCHVENLAEQEDP